MRSFWEQKVYRVCERKEDSPVYVVEPERGGKRRTIHRNMLFHCGEELPDDPESDVVCQKTKDASKVKKAALNNDEHQVDDEEESSHSEGEERVQEQRTARVRKKPTRLNYDGLGKPTVNAISITTSNRNNKNYRIWLEQLWTLGYLTDLLMKQQYSTTKPLYIKHSYKQTYVHNL